MNNPAMQQVILIGGMILVFYLIVLRPNQQQKKKHEQALMAIKKGDEIVTSGGIIADVIHVKVVAADGKPSFDDRLTVKSGESRLLVERGRVAHITGPAAAQSPSSKTPASSSAS